MSYAFKNAEYGWHIKVLRPFSKLFYPTVQAAKRAKDKMIRGCKESSVWANYLGTGGNKDIMPMQWYAEGVQLDFEGLKVTAPKEYDKWLTQTYGNYMELPPAEKRKTQHDTIVIDLEKSYLEYM